MSWTEVVIEIARAHAEALSDALMEAGALSVSVEDADEGTRSAAHRIRLGLRAHVHRGFHGEGDAHRQEEALTHAATPTVTPTLPMARRLFAPVLLALARHTGTMREAMEAVASLDGSVGSGFDRRIRRRGPRDPGWVRRRRNGSAGCFRSDGRALSCYE